MSSGSCSVATAPDPPVPLSAAAAPAIANPPPTAMLVASMTAAMREIPRRCMWYMNDPSGQGRAHDGPPRIAAHDVALPHLSEPDASY
ncbi:hypothetical protein GCM10009665_68470 [Kitasatospora nipponensis]|uniref:Uncharacterized protein n=1 Tax=Kitasatospora nipponensis TaxID=258049 RepID=A0ABP4HK96_9ACTN